MHIFYFTAVILFIIPGDNRSDKAGAIFSKAIFSNASLSTGMNST